MADTVIIDVITRLRDETKRGAGSAKKNLNDVENAADRVDNAFKRLSRTSKLSMVISAQDKASKAIDAVWASTKRIAGKTISIGLKAIDYATRPIRGVISALTSLQGMLMGSAGIAAGFVIPLSLSGDYEQIQISFETMLGSAERAQAFMKEMEAFANVTPFDFKGLAENSKLMLAFGFEAENVMDLMQTIGDTASGLGAGSEGIDRITRALGQMQAKGRPQAEELLQLQELGVPAAQILQEELGLTAEQVGNIGEAGLEASRVIQALLTGMDKRFGGMMTKQSKTLKGMMSTIKDTFDTKILKNWGDGLRAGIQPLLSNIVDWLSKNQDKLAEWGAALRRAGTAVGKWITEKIEDAQKAISDLVNSEAWNDAEGLWGKLAVAWDKLIAQPFSDWWNSTGKTFIMEKVGEIGEAIGAGLKTGLLFLLGFSESDAAADGASIGSSFIDGFMQGFDTAKIGEAFTQFAADNKGIIAGAAAVLATKLLGPVLSGVEKISNFFNKPKIPDMPDVGQSSGLGQMVTDTMNVTANIVNVYGGKVNDMGGGGSSFVDKAVDFGAQAFRWIAALGTGAKIAQAALTAGGGGGALALLGGAGAAGATTAGVTGASLLATIAPIAAVAAGALGAGLWGWSEIKKGNLTVNSENDPLNPFLEWTPEEAHYVARGDPTNPILTRMTNSDLINEYINGDKLLGMEAHPMSEGLIPVMEYAISRYGPDLEEGMKQLSGYANSAGAGFGASSTVPTDNMQNIGVAVQGALSEQISSAFAGVDFGLESLVPKAKEAVVEPIKNVLSMGLPAATATLCTDVMAGVDSGVPESVAAIDESTKGLLKGKIPPAFGAMWGNVASIVSTLAESAAVTMSKRASRFMSTLTNTVDRALASAESNLNLSDFNAGAASGVGGSFGAALSVGMETYEPIVDMGSYGSEEYEPDIFAQEYGADYQPLVDVTSTPDSASNSYGGVQVNVGGVTVQITAENGELDATRAGEEVANKIANAVAYLFEQTTSNMPKRLHA